MGIKRRKRNKPRMNKRGSHVGVMVSFAIFIFFLIFLYVVLEPISNSRAEPKSRIDLLAEKIIETISDDVNVTQIKIDNNRPNLCVDLNSDISGWEIVSKLGGPNLVIRDMKGNDLEMSVLDPAINLLRDAQPDTAFTAYYNFDHFPGKSGNPISGCQGIRYPGDYHLEQTKTYRYAFSKKISTLTSIYESNYTFLKKSFEINDFNDFNFRFTFANGTVIGPPEKEVTTDVYIREFPVQHMDQNASVYLGYLKIFYW